MMRALATTLACTINTAAAYPSFLTAPTGCAQPLNVRTHTISGCVSPLPYSVTRRVGLTAVRLAQPRSASCRPPAQVGRHFMVDAATRSTLALQVTRADGTVATPTDKCERHSLPLFVRSFLSRLELTAPVLAARRFLPCESVTVEIVGVPDDTASTKTAWVLDASLGTFLGDAPAVGCGGSRWQSETRAYARNPAASVLRMPPSSGGGPAVVTAALSSTPVSTQGHVQITAPLSLAVDPHGNASACAAPLPTNGGGDAAFASAPLPQMMKFHGCLQSFAWLLCLFPGAMAAR